MRVVHISDIHFGHMVDGIDRTEEFKEFIDFFSNEMIKIRPDCVVVAGDVFDIYFPSNEVIKLYYDFLLSLKDKTKKVIIIGGNHDSAKTLKAPKEILKYLDVVVVSGAEDDYVEFIEFDDFVVVAISYLRDGILKKYDKDYETALFKLYQEQLKKAKRFKNKKIITTAHLAVNGAKLGESERDIGNLNYVSKDVFSGYDYVLLGHIHRPQKLDKNIFYSGSVLPLSFKENYQKNYVLIENESVEFKPIKEFRKFVKISGSFDEVKSKLEKLNNAYVEIEFNENVDKVLINELKKTNNHIVKTILPYHKEIKELSIKKITPLEIVKEIFKDNESFDELIELYKSIEKEALNED
jgi:exonuclease SbcD